MRHKNRTAWIARVSVIGMLGMAGMTVYGAADEPAPLFPFLISYDGPTNATSVAHLLDAPAGKHGFIRVENGHFVNGKGRVRLNATNLTGPANFPTHEASDKLAARLARFGINCVRLHYFDAGYGSHLPEPIQQTAGIFGADPKSLRMFDPRQVDRQDYLIAALKRRGIYVNINLHVARTMDERDGFATKGRPPFDNGLNNFDPDLIAVQKEYAKDLLTRVNPYTGLAYTDDPCVAMIEISNENAMLFYYHYQNWLDRLPEPYSSELRRQWNVWLKKKYGTTAALQEVWKWVATPLRDEQVPEGDFSGPVTFGPTTWILEKSTSEATCAAEKGVLALEVTRDADAMFPKLFRRVTVKKGQTYTVAFKIRRTRGAGKDPLGFAVAEVKGGWRPLGVLSTFPVGADWTTITRVFEAADNSDTAEVQITRFCEGRYEIDDFSFKSGAASDYEPSARVEDGNVPIIKFVSGHVPSQARRDFYQFIIDTERMYWTGMRDYLRNDLKAKALVAGTQIDYSPAHVQADLDYVDKHGYWCHPSSVKRDEWHIGNTAMVSSMATPSSMASLRVHNKPYTISESSEPFPSQYGAEFQPMMRAYGALQGWDGVFAYTYNHSADFEPPRSAYFFHYLARTDVLAHLPACAAMYLRGDVREAEKTVVAAAGYAGYFDNLVASKSIALGIGSAGFDSRLGLIHKTAVDLTGKLGTDPASIKKPEGKVLVSDTGELTWSTERVGEGYWTVNTPHTKVFSGFPAGREIALSGVKLAVGKTRLNWATVSLVSRNATGFGQAGRPASILLAATGVSGNEGAEIVTLAENEITFRDRKDWGQGTVLVEGIPARVTLPSDPARTRCYALDPHGDRAKEVPVARAAGGGAEIAIGPAYRTVWYEIEVK